MPHRKSWVAAATVLVLGGAVHANSDDITTDPGYVDFGEMTHFGREQSDGGATYDHSTFQLLCDFWHDTDLCDAVAKLRQVRVTSVVLEGDETAQIEKATADFATKLEATGWLALAKVKDRREGRDSYVYVKMKDGKVRGVAIASINADEDATFVNIVGEIDPQKTAKLLDRLNLHLHTHTYDQDHEGSPDQD